MASPPRRGRPVRAGLLAVLALVTLPAAAQQCPIPHLVPQSDNLFEWPKEMTDAWRQSSADWDAELSIEGWGDARPRLEGRLLVAIERASDAARSYRVALLELHDARAPTRLIQATRALDAGVAQTVLDATAKATLATRYPPRPCNVMWLDGYYMRVTVGASGFGNVAGVSYAPSELPDSASGTLWRLGLLLADFAEDKAQADALLDAAAKVAAAPN